MYVGQFLVNPISPNTRRGARGIKRLNQNVELHPANQQLTLVDQFLRQMGLQIEEQFFM